MPKKHSIANERTAEKKGSFAGKLKDFYVRKYKVLFVFLILFSVLSSSGFLFTYFKTGDFLSRDVTLKGGISLTVHSSEADVASVESFLKEKFPKSSLNLRTIEANGKQVGIIIEASDITESELVSAVKQKVNLDSENYSVETMGSSLGESFFKQMFIALLVAFIAMGLVFHIYFRNLYSTGAALLSAFLDIFVTAGLMSFFGVRLTAGGIAAYLMLISYSIDTSILLSTKLLKESVDDANDALFGAMKTGLTMSATGIAATGISFLLTNNITLKQIMLILIVGLFVDILTTWIGNVSMLRFYLEKKNGKA
jgi:preprotein translocase subunit SecF